MSSAAWAGGVVVEGGAVGALRVVSGGPPEIGAFGFLGVFEIVIAALEEEDDEAFVEETGTEFSHVEVEYEGFVGFFESASALGGEGIGGVVTDEKVAGIAGFEFVAEAVGAFLLEGVFHVGFGGEGDDFIGLLEEIPGDAVVGFTVEDFAGHVGGLYPHGAIDGPVGEGDAAGDVVVFENGALVKEGGAAGEGFIGWGGGGGIGAEGDSK